ncbi:hypothetical protein GCM10009030_19660 [Haloarcula pellucida]|uniref:Transposase n=1 Tax=Haloarcula pellucida TaxID=1427151 RepID=A0A830GKN2_9EURY|nr:hypothetical protein GCM10009030_19660 [Halomicroarcula pellucida]
MGIRAGRLTDAYIVGIELRSHLRRQRSLHEALQSVDGPFDKLTDGYPNWHPAPSFHGMLKLFIYREVTGLSYRALTQRPDLAGPFGLDRIPDKPVLSPTWRKRFDGFVHGH